MIDLISDKRQCISDFLIHELHYKVSNTIMGSEYVVFYNVPFQDYPFTNQTIILTIPCSVDIFRYPNVKFIYTSDDNLILRTVINSSYSEKYNLFSETWNIYEQLRSNMMDKIPVHFIFEPIRYQVMPEQWKKNIRDFEFLNNQEYTLWNLDKIEKELLIKYPEYQNTFQILRKNQWICCLDFARYLILYEYGGVYFDLDIQFIRPLQSLFSLKKENDFIMLCKENNFAIDGQLNNCMIFCNSKNTFMKQILDEIVMNISEVELCYADSADKSVENSAAHSAAHIKNVLNFTGPTRLTRIIQKYISSESYNDSKLISFQNTPNGQVIILPLNFCCGEKIPLRSKMIHHSMDGSWTNGRRGYYSLV